MTFSFDHLFHHKGRGACALVGPHQGFIDHTAPICSILGIPLLTDQPEAKFIYESLYPGLNLVIKKWTLDYLLENYSTVFYPFRPIPSFNQLIQKGKQDNPQNPIYHLKTKFIYHLHGCSDKGYHSDWIAPKSHFLDVDQVLFYGRRMHDIFRDNGVLEKLRSFAFIGNYRYLYYLKYRDFYQKVISLNVFDHFEKEQPTLLYAPSWIDPEGSCSLFEGYRDLLDRLPSHFNLVLKLHPYLSIRTKDYDPTPLYRLLEPYLTKPNIVVVPQLPLVYPLLDRVVAYIGDFSSIGYDALAFNLPLFFLNHQNRSLEDKGAYLLRCGKVFYQGDFATLYPSIEKTLSEKQNPYLDLQKETYHYAFGKNKSYEELQTQLQELLNS